MAAFLFATGNIVFVSALVLMLLIGAVQAIDAAREAERAAIQVRVEAEAEKQAAADRAGDRREDRDGAAHAIAILTCPV